MDGDCRYLETLLLRPPHVPAPARPLGATTAVAEQECREMNVVSIGLTVFGSNKAAQTLCEDLGFKPTVLQMCRRLSRI